MAQSSTIFKVSLQIADMDRHYYADHLLTIAQHPSENDERLMMRILAFALNASENLSFAEGISDQTQADIWDTDLTGEIKLWINVGLPDDKLIKRACNKATQVKIYSYGGGAANVWWSKLKNHNYKNLSIYGISPEDSEKLQSLVRRGIKLNVTIQEGDIMLSSDNANINITLSTLC